MCIDDIDVWLLFLSSKSNWKNILSVVTEVDDSDDKGSRSNILHEIISNLIKELNTTSSNKDRRSV